MYVIRRYKMFESLTIKELIIILNLRLNDLKDIVPSYDNDTYIKVKLMSIEHILKILKIKLRLYEE